MNFSLPKLFLDVKMISRLKSDYTLHIPVRECVLTV